MDTVRHITARQIIASNGEPTVEVDFITSNGVIRSSAPLGLSKGTKEAKSLVDNGDTYNGKSVREAVSKINEIKESLQRESFADPISFDEYLIELDGTPDKSNLGANAMLPLSICCYKLFARASSTPLFNFISSVHGRRVRVPIPHFNVLNGGVHSGNGMWCQEIMVAFHKATFSENLERACTLYESLKRLIGERYGCVFQSVGDEGGFAPPIKTLVEGIELLLDAGKACGAGDFKIAFDFAANEFFSGDRYEIEGAALTGRQLASYYEELIDKYPMIYSMEDPFSESDAESWAYFYGLAGQKINIVADDLTTTHTAVIDSMMDGRVFNTVLIKPNQVGTASEAAAAAAVAAEHGCKIMASHRSADTEDNFICHFAVGLGAEYIKCGAPCRGEHTFKYNELLRIEEALEETGK